MKNKPAMPKIDLNPYDWEEVSRILRIHVPGHEVWAFGSRVKWTAKQYSDLDLAVITEQPLPLSIYADLKNAFDESGLSIKVDVVDWATISDSFRRIIEKDRVLVQKPRPGLENWTFKRLVDCTRDGNLSYGIVQPGQHDENGIPIVRVNNINNGQLRLSDVLRVSPAIEAKYKRTRLEGGEVLLTLVGSTGQSVVVPIELASWNIARAIAVIRPRPEIGANWINICLQSKDVQQFLDERANTTVQKTLNLGDVKEVPIPIPPRVVKDAIESVAMALADKIELNRRMNETLEAIARAMFKSWFVDFDPVRAKASGELPESICRRLGLTPDLLAVFPERLVDSELGEIPEGWEVKPLDGIADYLNGLALQKFPPKNDSEWLPVVKIAQLKKGDSVGADHASHKLKPEYIVDDGDVLFSWSGSLEVDIWCGGRGALNQHIFKVTSTNYPKWFYFYWTKHHLSHFQAVAAGKAVTMGHIQRKHLTEALCAVPQKTLMERLGEIVAPLLDKQIENRKESRALGVMRDTLLPKLLSGELRVPVAKVEVEATA